MTLDIIRAYQKDPSKENAENVLKAHSDFISANANKWKGILPDPVLNAYARNYALQAFKTFNSEKANINTHLYNNLSQLSRIIYEHQNVAKIPEHQLQLIGRVEQAKSYLSDTLNHEPSVHDIADHLSLPAIHIERIMHNNRADFLNDSDAETQQFATGTNTKAQEQIFSVRQSLTPVQRKQFDDLTGFGGTKPLEPSEFAKKHKLKPYEVSRLKTAFAKRFK